MAGLNTLISNSSDFRGANFSWSLLEDSIFDNSNISNSNFECAFCFNARFNNTTYRNANFQLACYLDFLKLGDGYELNVNAIRAKLDSEGFIYTPPGFMGDMSRYSIIKKWERRFEEEFSA